MVGFDSLGTRINDFISTASFGLVGGAGIGAAVDSLTGNRVGVLANLADGYLEVALGRGTTAFERMLGTGTLPIGPMVMDPTAAYSTYQGMCAGCYAGASPYTASAMLGAFGGAQAGAGTVMGILQGMDAAILGQLGQMTGGYAMYGAGSLFQNPFMGLTATGLASVAGMQGVAGVGAGAYDNSGAYGGRGFGSWTPLAQPGQINNTNPYYESAHQAQAATLLADPSLTVEDKVTLLLMLIMNKMDDDIERQAQYVNSIQQQQSARADETSTTTGKGGMYGLTGTSATDDDSSPSIDVETMKLKRMIDKRSQMFDMLRQIIDKYNETAKGIIQSIGR